MPLRKSVAGAACLTWVLALLTLAPAAQAADEGRIDGRVLGGAPAAPLLDAGVDLYRFVEPGGPWQRVGFDWTDAAGHFRFPDLAAGQYRVCAFSNEGSPPHSTPIYARRCWQAAETVETADDITLAENEVVRRIDVRLPARGRILGHVTDPNGDPVSQGYARAYYRDGNGDWVFDVFSGLQSDGSYELRVDGARVYHVCFQIFETVEWASECWQDAVALPSSTRIRGATPNRTVTGIDAQVDLAGKLSGVITGYPVGTQGTIAISAERLVEGEWWAIGFANLEPLGNPIQFEIGALPPGDDYRVCFTSQDYEFFPVFPNECVGGTPNAATGTPIPVVAGQVTPGADVDLGSASDISGRVGGAPGPVSVQLLTESGALIYTRQTLANGTYGFSGLPNGTYKLAFNRAPAETRLAARFYRGKPEHLGVEAATPIVLGSGVAIHDLTTGLVEGGSLTGRVVNTTHVGVPGCQLRARAPDGSLAERLEASKPGGQFNLGGLTTGSYQLVIDRDTCGNDRNLYYDADAPSLLSHNPARADTVAVTLGATTALPGSLVVDG